MCSVYWEPDTNLLDESDIGGQTVSFDELDEDIMGVCRIEDALNSRNGSSKTSIRLPDNLAGQIIFDQNSGEPAFVQVPSAENYRSSAESLGGFYEDYRPVKAITISILCGAVFLNASVVMVNLANPLPENRPR